MYSILFGDDSFPEILDILKIKPRSETKNLYGYFLGLENISISGSLEILNLIQIDIYLEVGIPTGIKTHISIPKAINLFNGLL